MRPMASAGESLIPFLLGKLIDSVAFRAAGGAVPLSLSDRSP